jgi:hypothetical protein
MVDILPDPQKGQDTAIQYVNGQEELQISPKTVLFTDFRHIRCGDLQWRTPDNRTLFVAGPPQPEVQPHADLDVLPRGIELIAQKPSKTDRLPEGQRHSAIIYDGGVYRSWYLDSTFKGKPVGGYLREYPDLVNICYTESKDAIEWTEKSRSPIDVLGQRGFDGFTFFIDPHGPPDERYKILYSAIPPESQKKGLWEEHEKLHPRYKYDHRLGKHNFHCMYAAVSPDGLTWKAVPDPLFVHVSDTDTTVFWDEWLGKYVMFTRLYPWGRRANARAESEDFYNWGPLEPFMRPSLDWDPTDDIYTNGYSEYPGSPTYRFMFPNVYRRYDQTYIGPRMYSSDDGIYWHEVPGGPIIQPGEPGSWDSEMVGIGKHLIPFGKNRVAVPYSGRPYPHKYPRWPHPLKYPEYSSMAPEQRTSILRGGRAYAWWPRGRLSALNANQEGEFFTFSMRPPGRSLRLNASTKLGGEVRVGIVNVPGDTRAETTYRGYDNVRVGWSNIDNRSVDECTPIIGDELAKPVSWHGETDIGSQNDQPVTLHFKLRAAKLFGFDWV